MFKIRHKWSLHNFCDEPEMQEIAIPVQYNGHEYIKVEQNFGSNRKLAWFMSNCMVGQSFLLFVPAIVISTLYVHLIVTSFKTQLCFIKYQIGVSVQ